MFFIPNEETWVGFAAALTGSMTAPKVADITGAVDLSPLVVGITATSTGATVPTPRFSQRWNGSIPGTIDGQFSMDCYRDKVALADLAWATLPRETIGFIIIARSGGIPSTAGKDCETWPIAVTSRSVPQMTSNTAVTTTITAAVPTQPAEDAVVVA